MSTNNNNEKIKVYESPFFNGPDFKGYYGRDFARFLDRLHRHYPCLDEKTLDDLLTFLGIIQGVFAGSNSDVMREDAN